MATLTSEGWCVTATFLSQPGHALFQGVEGRVGSAVQIVQRPGHLGLRLAASSSVRHRETPARCCMGRRSCSRRRPWRGTGRTQKALLPRTSSATCSSVTSGDWMRCVSASEQLYPPGSPPEPGSSGPQATGSTHTKSARQALQYCPHALTLPPRLSSSPSASRPPAGGEAPLSPYTALNHDGFPIDSFSALKRRSGSSRPSGGRPRAAAPTLPAPRTARFRAGRPSGPPVKGTMAGRHPVTAPVPHAHFLDPRDGQGPAPEVRRLHAPWHLGKDEAHPCVAHRRQT